MKTMLRTKTFWLVVSVIVVLALAVFFGSWRSAPLVSAISGGGTLFLPIVIVAALADSVNPCAFSVLLITIAFLLSLGKGRREILQIGGLYILGIFLVYILIGLGILQALHLFNTPHFMAKVGAVLLILLGTSQLVGHLFPSFPVKFRIPSATKGAMAKVMRKGSFPAAFVLGVLVGLCEFPCTGGPYLAILGLLHDAGSYTRGLGYLLLYNLIFVAPLVLILLLAGNRDALQKVETWKKENAGNMRLYGGIVMILLGAVMFLI